MTGHVHAALMLRYAQDAAENPNPWTLWEVRRLGELDWNSLGVSPSWDPIYEYRRKLKMMKVARLAADGPAHMPLVYEFPEPLRMAPEEGSDVYVPDVTDDSTPYITYAWNNMRTDLAHCLRCGLLHATEDAARQHARALIALSAPL